MTVYVPIALQRLVRERFRGCCAYCRTAEHLTATSFEFEHILPVSAGGPTVFDNLFLSCPMCNRYKSNRAIGTDPDTKTDVPLFHPQRQQWDDHFTWMLNGAELMGRTPTGRATSAMLNINRPALIRVRRLWVAMNEHPPIIEVDS